LVLPLLQPRWCCYAAAAFAIGVAAAVALAAAVLLLPLFFCSAAVSTALANVATAF
jgi:hypothetical protein